MSLSRRLFINIEEYFFTKLINEKKHKQNYSQRMKDRQMDKINILFLKAFIHIFDET